MPGISGYGVITPLNIGVLLKGDATTPAVKVTTSPILSCATVLQQADSFTKITEPAVVVNPLLPVCPKERVGVLMIADVVFMEGFVPPPRLILTKNEKKYLPFTGAVNEGGVPAPSPG